MADATRLGFIGTGAITEAIVTGLLRADAPVERITISERNREISARLAGLSPKVVVSGDNQAIVDASDVVFLAIRPQVAEEVLKGLAFPPDKEIVSLIAALPIETLRAWVGPVEKVSRAIPLPSVAELRGVTAVFPEVEVPVQLFSPLGTVVVASSLKEFNSYAVASALMGTYFAMLESIAQWMKQAGADYEASCAYLTALFAGLAGTASEDGRDFERLRIDHTTPNGLNQLARDVFEQQGGLDALHAALSLVLERVEHQGFLKPAR